MIPTSTIVHYYLLQAYAIMPVPHNKHPSLRDTYEQRLFRPFEDALPPPPHYHSGRVVVHKPDLPPVFGVHEAAINPNSGDT